MRDVRSLGHVQTGRRCAFRSAKAPSDRGEGHGSSKEAPCHAVRAIECEKVRPASRNPVWRNAPSDDELDLIRPTLEELESLFEPLTARISFETKPAIIFRCEPETK